MAKSYKPSEEEEEEDEEEEEASRGRRRERGRGGVVQLSRTFAGRGLAVRSRGARRGVRLAVGAGAGRGLGRRRIVMSRRRCRRRMIDVSGCVRLSRALIGSILAGGRSGRPVHPPGKLLRRRSVSIRRRPRHIQSLMKTRRWILLSRIPDPV